MPPAAQAWALRGLALAVLGGAFAGTAATWGFDHLAYLPAWALAPTALLAAALFLPDRLLGAGGDGAALRLAPGVPSRPAWTILAALAVGVLFTLLRTRSHFLGDGYLLLDILGRDHGPRPSGSLAWLAMKALADGRAATPAQALVFFRVVAVVAGVGGFLLVCRLLPRTGWEPGRQRLFLGLHLAGAASLLYCGYVETYALSFAFLTAFTLAGVGAAAGRVRLAWPSLLLAAAVASHLGALLALPALVLLAVADRTPPGAARGGSHGAAPGGRWRRLPAAVLPVLGVLLILVVALAAQRTGGAGAGGPVDAAGLAGADGIVGAGPADVLRPLSGTYGLLTLRTLVDVANLALLLVPVPLVMIVTARRRARAARDDAPAAGRAVPVAPGARRFLAVHAGCVLLAAFALDPKLGAARDWDLLAPHTAAVIALAVMVAPATVPSRRRLVAAALACSLPWFLVGARAPAAERRLATVASAFPPYARGYAFEGLGLHHRQAGRHDEVVAMYRAATEAQPGNARFQALLGAALVALHNDLDERGEPTANLLELAEASYREAHRLNPGYPAVADNLARLCARRGGYAEAERLLAGLAARHTLTADQLKLAFECQYRQGAFERARRTLTRLVTAHPQAEVPAAWRAWLAGAAGTIGAVD